jgi:hypothetical protein
MVIGGHKKTENPGCANAARVSYRIGDYVTNYIGYCRSFSTDCGFWFAWANIDVPACTRIWYLA